MTRTVPQAITAVPTPKPAQPTREPTLVPDEAIDQVLEAATLAAISGKPLSEVQRLEDARVKAAAETPPPEPEPAPEPVPTPEVETPVETAPVEEVEPEPEIELPAGDTPQEEEIPASEIAAVEGKPLPKRIKAKSDEDRVIFAMAVDKGISVAEATRRYDKLKADHAAPVPAAVQSAPSPKVQALEQRVAELETVMDGLTDGIPTADSVKALKEYPKAVAALERTRMEEQQQAMDEAAANRTWQRVLADTEKTYPEMRDHDSPQYVLAKDMAAKAAANPNHPDHEAGCTADAPRYFAEKAAAKLKISPVAAKAQLKIPVVPAKPGQPKPASGNRQTLPAKPAKSAEQEVAEAEANVFAEISGNKNSSPHRSGLLVI